MIHHFTSIPHLNNEANRKARNYHFNVGKNDWRRLLLCNNFVIFSSFFFFFPFNFAFHYFLGKEFQNHWALDTGYVVFFPDNIHVLCTSNKTVVFCISYTLTLAIKLVRYDNKLLRFFFLKHAVETYLNVIVTI